MHDFGAFSTKGDGGGLPPGDAGQDVTAPTDAPGTDSATLDASADADTATTNDSSGPDTGTDAPPPLDAPPDAPAEAGSDPGILCGASHCNASSQVCCQESPAPVCLPQPGAACTGFTMPCDDAADCASAGLPGDECCALVRSNGSVTSVTCVAAGQCRNAGPNIAFVLCDPSVASPCAAPRTCGPNGTGAASLNGYFTCN